MGTLTLTRPVELPPILAQELERKRAAAAQELERKRSVHRRQKIHTRTRPYARLRELGITAFDRLEPLRVHIHHEMQALFKDEFKPAEISGFLAFHTQRLGYLTNVAKDRARVELDGTVRGVPTESDQAHALTQLAARYPAAGGSMR